MTTFRAHGTENVVDFRADEATGTGSGRTSKKNQQTRKDSWLRQAGIRMLK
jgi:hypothetical protein